MHRLADRIRFQSGPVVRLIMMGVALAGTSGCFDADALIEERRRLALLHQLEEIDLGEYRFALPRLPGESRGGVVAFHAFGQIANRDRDAVAAQLEADDPLIRHQMLVAIRELTAEDLEDPELNELRKAVGGVINGALVDELIQRVGFYKFSFALL